jgi:tetratricopeptide (TPR) repeat protein
MNPLGEVTASIGRKDFPRALRLLDRLNAARSRDPEMLGLYGYVNFKLGRFEQAETCVSSALRNRSGDARLLNLLCNVQIGQGHLERAKKTATRCLSADPGNADATFNLGCICFRLGEYEQAEKQFIEILRHNPSSSEALTYLGLIRQRASRLREALEFYDRALVTDPDSAEALQNKGVVLNQLLEPKQAITCLERANSRRPDNPTICQNLASSYVLTGDSEKALHFFMKAIRLEPLNPEHHHWCNLFLWKEGRREFLQSYYDVLRESPDAHAIRRELVQKLRLANRFEESEQQLDILIDKDASDPENYRLKGEILRNQRRFEEALDAHRVAYRLSQDDVVVKEALATSYLSLHEAEKALELIRQLTASDFGNQGYWALKAIALRLLDSEEYQWLYNYEQLVLKDHIEPPRDFSTLEQFNQELLDELRKYHTARTQPLDQSLLHGTQSLGDLFQDASEILRLLKNALDKKVTQFLRSLPSDDAHPVLARNKGSFSYAGAWSIMLESSGYHVNHFHSEGWYSGPYYVHLPREVRDGNERHGWIKLGEPGFEMAEPLTADYVLKPEEGMLIRFPSCMWHGTYPFSSSDKRVIVGCDIVP